MSSRSDATRSSASKPSRSNTTESSAPKPSRSDITKSSASKPSRSDTTKSSASKPSRSDITKSSTPKPSRSNITESSAPKPSRSNITESSAPKPSRPDTIKSSASKPSSSRPEDLNPATREIEPKDYDLNVDTIRVTVHTMGKFLESDTRSGNHASIFLLTSNGASVRLNMTKLNAYARRGDFQITYCRYQRTNSSLRDFDLKATGQGLKVKQVLRLITEKRRDKYKLARSGLGCRFWVQTVIKDFQEMEFISSSSNVSTGDVVEGLRYNYSKGKKPEIDEIDPGSFR